MEPFTAFNNLAVWDAAWVFSRQWIYLLIFGSTSALSVFFLFLKKNRGTESLIFLSFSLLSVIAYLLKVQHFTWGLEEIITLSLTFTVVFLSLRMPKFVGLPALLFLLLSAVFFNVAKGNGLPLREEATVSALRFVGAEEKPLWEIWKGGEVIFSSSQTLTTLQVPGPWELLGARAWLIPEKGKETNTFLNVCRFLGLVLEKEFLPSDFKPWEVHDLVWSPEKGYFWLEPADRLAQVLLK